MRTRGPWETEERTSDVRRHAFMEFPGSVQGPVLECGSRRLTACPDPSNWAGREFWTAECPADVREKVFSGAAKLAPKATQSHLKIKGVVDGRLVGFGDDLVRLIRSYREAGYEGGIAFESIAEGDLLAPMVKAREVVEAAIASVIARTSADTRTTAD